MNAHDRRLLFVYGTLKRDGSNHSFLAEQSFCGEARTVPGFKLVNLGEYPGMVVDPSDTRGVAGEVWSVDPECVANLDELEGLAEGLYRRERINLQPPFDQSAVETYIYALDTIGRPSLPDGFWRI